jgi:ABC-type nickel/cobalt efflux system permease component RcnA
MEAFSQIFSVTPSVAALQIGLAAGALLLVFFVLFATRDILLRADSFLYQLACIVLVAALPVVGFLLYLLIRPARTRKQRQLENDVRALIARFQAQQQHHHQPKKRHHQGAPHAQGFKMKTPKELAEVA